LTHARCGILTPLRAALHKQGGAGFIGSHATLRLLMDGHTVTIVVRAAALRADACAARTRTHASR
jgi:NAD dependent epimerase/dehydratase family enzyme